MVGARHDLQGSLLAGVSFSYRQRTVSPGSRKGLALLFVVSVRDEPTPRSYVAELLWGPRRSHNVRQALSELRKLPGALSWLDARDPVAVRATTDLHRFRAAARAGDHAAAVAVWRAATGGVLWPQLPWAQLEAHATSAFHEWLEAERAELHATFLTCLQAHAAELELRAEYADALSLVRAALATDALNEGLHRAAMRLHAAMGNPLAALVQFELCRTALARDLGVDPLPATLGLARELEAVMAPTPAAAGRSARTPRRPIPFVGHTGETRALEALLATGNARLITLVGPGGVGKTRLALELAERWGTRFEHGVAIAPMTSVSEAATVSGALGEAVGLPVSEADDAEPLLAAHLRSRHLLLLIDDIVQPAEGVGIIATLLDACPTLTVLATSRQPLGIAGEQVFALAGLGHVAPGAPARLAP